MNTPQGIIIFGPNGGGKTTTGREVARLLGFKHMDIEDYTFLESEVPYTAVRPQEESLRLMLDDIERYRSFVLTAVTGEFGSVIPSYYRLAAHIDAPIDLRMERVAQRSLHDHGERVLPGGDMYASNQDFLAFAKARDLTKIDRWAQSLSCPVIRIDGALDWRERAALIAEHWRKKDD